MEAILFDLDGTLLPMDMKEFTTGYFGLLAETAAPYGYGAKELVASLWKGVTAMVKNDGMQSNEARFWQSFVEDYGERALAAHRPVFDRFYATDFDRAVRFTQPNPRAAEAVRLARQAAKQVILATNPLFPAAGVRTRLRWIGLTMKDFDDVTTYENSAYCKPNPDYYRALLQRCGLHPESCVMVGNDVGEDILAAQAAGLDTYLVTDCAIGLDTPHESERGSFSALLEWLRTLPKAV